MARDEAADHGPQQMAQHKGQQQLQRDLADGLQRVAPSALLCSSMLTRMGVITMPISVEADALHTAAGMLPRAMAVKAMADCTVAGSVHRKSTPMYISA